MLEYLDYMDYIEMRANLIMAEMAAIDEKVEEILALNERLRREVRDPAVLKIIQDSLYNEFRVLVVEFDELERQLDELGTEYDALLFVAALAVPAA